MIHRMWGARLASGKETLRGVEVGEVQGAHIRAPWAEHIESKFLEKYRQQLAQEKLFNIVDYQRNKRNFQ